MGASSESGGRLKESRQVQGQGVSPKLGISLDLHDPTFHLEHCKSVLLLDFIVCHC
jgi:hypothetical protein